MKRIYTVTVDVEVEADSTKAADLVAEEAARAIAGTQGAEGGGSVLGVWEWKPTGTARLHRKNEKKAVKESLSAE